MGAFDSVPNIVIPDPENAEEAAAFRKRWKWEPHEMVIIKGQYTTAMQETVGNAASAITGKGKDRDITLTSGSMRRTLLEVMIVDWTLAENGRKVAVTPASIRRLPANYSTPILEMCDELAAGMSEEEQEDFLHSANGHTVESSSEMSPFPMLS